MKRFSIVNNGYDINEVNRFIDIVIGRLEKLNAENASYADKIDKLNTKLKENNNTYDFNKLEKTLLAVQETADRVKEVAKEEARVIVDEAKNNANSIVHEALVNAQKTEQERAILEKNMKVYKQRLRSLIEGQLELVDEIDKMDIVKEVE